jgi:SAM-dependent methyltransferase
MSNPHTKYYDWNRSSPLDAKSDGCTFEQWETLHETHAFAVHRDGFLVFLPPSLLETTDEYVDADPYTVDFAAPFHRRRVDLTRELMLEAAEKTKVQRVLDIGCGEGHITELLRESLPGVEFSGLDYSVSAVANGALKYPKLDLIVADAYEPPYAPAHFDIVICNNLWEHVPDPLRLLSSIARVLRVGGYLIVSTPSRYRIQNLLRVAMGQPVTFASTHHVTEYSVGQVTEQLRFGGFTVDHWASRPISSEITTWKLRILYSTLVPILRLWLKRSGQHHSLESTVFTLARRSS